MKTRYPLIAAIALALALAPAGCGGDEGEESNGAGTNTSTTAERGGQGQASANDASPGSGKSAKEDERNGGGAEGVARQDIPVGNPTPGAKEPAPGVPITRGGDNSIQVFGVEGEASSRTQAAQNLTAYLAAFEAGDWPRACALGSEVYREQLSRLVANARAKDGAEKPRGCAATLEVLFGGGLNEAALRSFRVEEVLSFRIEGEYAYLIYRNVEGEAMFIAMADDDGEWKVNVTQPASFNLGSSL